MDLKDHLVQPFSAKAQFRQDNPAPHPAESLKRPVFGNPLLYTTVLLQGELAGRKIKEFKTAQPASN